MKMLSDLTADYVRNILAYDRETGEMYWKRRHDVAPEWNTRRAGTRAGGRMINGYWMICINNRRYLRHRLAWLIETGFWPIGDIDHKNLIRGDDHFDNLREASSTQNKFNRGRDPRNTSGQKGVGFHKATGLWRARASAHGKYLFCLYFRTKQEAIEAYAQEIAKHHGEFARLS